MNNLLDTCVFAEYQKKQPNGKVVAWVDSRIEETLRWNAVHLGGNQCGRREKERREL